MKKITLLFLLSASLSVMAQSYSTGVISLSGTSGLQMTAKIDVSTQVTLTLTGPSDRWFAVGFDASSMTAGTDVVICDGSATITSFDRHLTGFASPVADGQQNWTITSNTVASGVRTIVATRALNTGDANDYTFSAAATSLNLIWARANSATFSLGYHGGSNRGVATSNLSLGTNDAVDALFRIYPNPTTDYVLVTLPNGIDTAEYKLIDITGKEMKSGVVNQNNNQISLNNMSSGNYIVKIIAGQYESNQKLVVN